MPLLPPPLHTHAQPGDARSPTQRPAARSTRPCSPPWSGPCSLGNSVTHLFLTWPSLRPPSLPRRPRPGPQNTLRTRGSVERDGPACRVQLRSPPPPIGVSCPHAPHEPRCRAPGGCASRGRAGLPTAGARPLTRRARGRHRETLAACPVLSLGTRAFAGVSVLKVSSGVPELSARSQPDGPRRALRGPTPPRSPPLPGLPQVMVATKPPVAGTSNATTALAIGLGTEN